MIKNYLTTIFRAVLRDKLFSFINILGMAVGMAVFLLIIFWIKGETTFDSFNKNADNIYRVERHFHYHDFNVEMPITSPPYGRKMVEVFPEVIRSIRLHPVELSLRDENNIYRKNKVFFADSNIFQSFTFPLLKGNSETALSMPNTAVFSINAAHKYFGRIPEPGESISMEYDNTIVELEITGIMENIPANSHFHPEIFISFNTLYHFMGDRLGNWQNNFIYSYIELEKGADTQKFRNALPGFLKNFVTEAYSNIINPGDDINDVITLKIKKITDIHLHSNLEFELEKNGNISMIYIFSAVAFLILLIAIINFINLTTAKSGTRFLEIGVRKMAGANRKHLIKQLLGEAVLMSVLSFCLSILIIDFAKPIYQNLTGVIFNWSFITEFPNNVYVVSFVLFTGVIAGIYPAFILSSFNPSRLLKWSEFKTKSGFSLRKGLVIFQFFISIGLMICSLLVFLQLEFLQNKELGYNKKNVLIIPVEKQNIRQQYESFRTDLLAHSDIEQVTSTSDIPDSHMYEASGFKIEGSNNTYPLIHFGVNYDFFETLKMKLIAGRFYSRDFSDTAENRYIINKSAVHAFGWTNPAEAIGKKCNAVTNLPDLPGSGIIIGVVDDFHFKSLEMSIEPLVILLSPEENNHIFIRLNPNEVSETLYKIKEMWQNRFPDTEFQYSFLEERLNDQYSDEDSLKRKLFLSTFLAVFIACLGLFGLSVFVIQRREKEVGIRKVLGASEMTIIKLLCGDYLRLILISALLSWPLSYFLIMTWLQNFAERIAILNYWWVFVFAGLLAIVISLVTIGVQTLKYSRINPVESLKYE